MENTESKTNVAQQMVDIMADAGIKHMYAITGDSLNDLTDAISKEDRIKFIHMRHEESGAFAASAEAQLTGRIACCAGSSGPGHVHLINGLYDAQRSEAPVLAIASTCASSVFGTEYFQETNPTLLFSNCNVYNEMAVTPTQVPHMLQAAMQEAIGRGGVGIIGVPQDVTSQEAIPSSASTKLMYTKKLPQPSDEELQKCADILNNAKKVVLFAGYGAKEATRELKEFASLMNAPVVTTFKSQFELTKDCPQYVGHLAYLGMYSGVNAVADADAILMIGQHFPFPGFFPTGRQIIEVDIRPERLGRVADSSLGINSDSKIFLEGLIPLLKQKDDKTFLETALKEYSEIKQKMQIPVNNPGTEGKIRPEFVFSTLNRLASDNCVFTIDTGMNCVWASHYLTPSRDRKMIGSFMHGSMANAMPQAIGAAVSCPERQIIACSGDGGLAMLMGDLLTIVQYQLPVKILVADNSSLAYVKWEMELAGMKPSEVNLKNPDFGEMARSMGFTAITVTTPENLESAMSEWLSAKGPALLSVTTDADAASFTFSKEMMDGAKPSSVVENFIAPGS